MGLLTNITRDDLTMRFDFGQHIVLAFKRDKRRVDYIGFEGEGPQKLFSSVDSFERTFNRVSEEGPTVFLPKFLKAVKRAYLPGEGVAHIIMELLKMSTLNGKAHKDCTVTELTVHYNALRAASGAAPVSDKAFKSKAKLIEAVETAERLATAPTPEQLQNKKTNAAAAEKRLAGLATLKEQKAEEADARRKTKAEKAAKKEDAMSTKPEKTAKPKAAPKTEKPAARPEKLPAKAPFKADKPKAAPAKPEKATKPKAAAKPEKTASAGRGKGIGSFCMELILKGKSNEEAAEAARKEFGSTTSASSVAWYRNKLKGEGKL